MSRSAARGFTLIELLIALVLTGLIMMLLFGGLRLSTRSWDSSERYQQQVSEQALLQQRLRDWISQALSRRVRGPNGEVLSTFWGDRDELIFMAPGRDSGPSGALYWYRLYQREEQGRSMLMLAIRLFDQEEAVDWNRLFAVDEVGVEGADIQIDEYPLMSLGDGQLEMQYWEQPDQLPVVRSDWIDQPRLPRLVEVRVTESESPPVKGYWPPLAIVLEEYNHAVRQR
ncbi:prepilin-type N-terminal cleavage/methylation domain-containing protein [Marinobacterium marinum]|uniref:Prepilin-type N-terminal cleavage/methylation domain-containing protein n=1 Tax=Marinobacterium marinum TaxID=2756129 RepID=A0A7W2ABK7_9GAMM|nr:prepilin-type N-terminal cleavage/methylation domain-containing protein [Marinobacterium marinum]MBA4501554.1 prepilin-type N-terminal cleavage/methylation domain-containing protein [Marinobacterium marinum]